MNRGASRTESKVEVLVIDFFAVLRRVARCASATYRPLTDVGFCNAQLVLLALESLVCHKSNEYTW